MNEDPKRNAEQQSDAGKLDVRLKKPRSTLLTLSITALAVLAVVTLLGVIFRAGAPPADRVPAATSAADKVVEMTSELSDDKRPREAPAEALPTSLNGVGFTLALAPGWHAESASRQIFLRKQGDARVCQITAQSPFDTKGFQTEVKDQESAFENTTMTEALSAGVPPNVKVSVSSTVLDRVNADGRYRYVVHTATLLKMGAQSSTQAGINATAMAGEEMVRLQCSNTAGTGDADGAMESMGRSLDVVPR